MEENSTVFGYVMFPEHLRRVYLIQEMDDSHVQGGLVDQFEVQSYHVTVVKSIHIVINNHFYRMLINFLDGTNRVLYGNLPFHAEALVIDDS